MVGGWRDRMWPDGWTSVTADGKRSAQFEHTLLVISFFYFLVQLSELYEKSSVVLVLSHSWRNLPLHSTL